MQVELRSGANPSLGKSVNVLYCLEFRVLFTSGFDLMVRIGSKGRRMSICCWDEFLKEYEFNSAGYHGGIECEEQP